MQKKVQTFCAALHHAQCISQGVSTVTTVTENGYRGKWVKLEKESFLTPPRMRRDNCHSCSKIRQLHIVIHFVHWCIATWQLANCDNCDKHGHMVTLCIAWLTLCNVTTVPLILVDCDCCASDPGKFLIPESGGGVGPAGMGKW